MGQCPSSFRPLGMACAADCPTDKGFEFQLSSGGQPRCVYKDAPEFFVNLFPVEWVKTGSNPIPDLTMDSLQQYDPTAYAKFKTEQDRVTQELAVLYEKIGKDKKLADAFQKLQDAENARDKAPDAYQQARANYYTLKEGETWVETEKERLLKAEVNPILQKFVEMRSNALRQYENQRKTVDVVNGLKDKVLSLKDEVKYAADTFKDQLGKVENAIQRERRLEGQKDTTFWDWLDTLLNVIILGALAYLAFIVYRKYAAKPAVNTPSNNL